MYQMPFFKFLLFTILLTGCIQQKKAESAKLKAQHDANMKLWRSLPEPFINKVPDSMKHWIPVLRNAFADDQKYRIVGLTAADFSREEMKEQKKIDSQNLKIAISYLDQNGWPKLYDAGLLGQRTIGIIIQHAPLNIQEKYYPFLVEAYKKDSLLYETLALLEDRINMRNHKFQYYGSQLVSYKGKMVLYPVYNIDSLDEYRKSIGFKMTLKQYLKLLKTDSSITNYKQLLPELIKTFKVSGSLGLHYYKK
jgi:hypothetical protein